MFQLVEDHLSSVQQQQSSQVAPQSCREVACWGDVKLLPNAPDNAQEVEEVTVDLAGASWVILFITLPMLVQSRISLGLWITWPLWHGNRSQGMSSSISIRAAIDNYGQHRSSQVRFLKWASFIYYLSTYLIVILVIRADSTAWAEAFLWILRESPSRGEQLCPFEVQDDIHPHPYHERLDIWCNSKCAC